MTSFPTPTQEKKEMIAKLSIVKCDAVVEKKRKRVTIDTTKNMTKYFDDGVFHDINDQSVKLREHLTEMMEDVSNKISYAEQEYLRIYSESIKVYEEDNDHISHQLRTGPYESRVVKFTVQYNRLLYQLETVIDQDTEEYESIIASYSQL